MFSEFIKRQVVILKLCFSLLHHQKSKQALDYVTTFKYKETSLGRVWLPKPFQFYNSYWSRQWDCIIGSNQAKPRWSHMFIDKGIQAFILGKDGELGQNVSKLHLQRVTVIQGTRNEGLHTERLVWI